VGHVSETLEKLGALLGIEVILKSAVRRIEY